MSFETRVFLEVLLICNFDELATEFAPNRVVAASQHDTGEGYGGVYIPVAGGGEEGIALHVVQPPTEGACDLNN